MVLIIKIMIYTSASRGNKFIDSNSIVVEITDAQIKWDKTKQPTYCSMQKKISFFIQQRSII
jgi:hypothetical protein